MNELTALAVIVLPGFALVFGLSLWAVRKAVKRNRTP